ncbi:17355_t:CDS:1, partial [Dentiscutata heterogama]
PLLGGNDDTSGHSYASTSTAVTNLAQNCPEEMRTLPPRSP